MMLRYFYLLFVLLLLPINLWATTCAPPLVNAPDTSPVPNDFVQLVQQIHHYQQQPHALETLATLLHQQCAHPNWDATQQALLHSYRADALLRLQRIGEAKNAVEAGLARQPTAEVVAHLYNNLGNIHVVETAFDAAQQAYQQAFAQIANQPATILHVQVLLNQVRLFLRQQQWDAAVDALDRNINYLKQIPDSLEKNLVVLNWVNSELQLYQQQQILSRLSPIVSALQTLADQQQDLRLQAYAKGYLGAVYENRQRYPEALQLTREAIFIAQDLPELRYRWEWQRGRILFAQNHIAEAIQAYQLALDELQPLRSQLLYGQRDPSTVFYEQVRPVYFGLADLLLLQAANTVDNTHKAELLQQVRETLEKLKTAELKNFFRDECLVNRRQAAPVIEQLDQHTAVLYPVILPQRTELLLSLPQHGTQQFVIPVDEARITTTIVEFQKNLQSRISFRYLNQARRLYQWLIQPLRATLTQHQIDTLIVIPDAALRMIPFAALFDGKQFLVEHYALVVTPGLTLTDAQPLQTENLNILLQGLSQGVQNFPPLPNVPYEIKAIQALFDEKNRRILLDEQFSLADVDHTLQATPYSIVHIASHGQFKRDPRQTFLLTYDSRITMNKLEQLLNLSEIRQTPVELLTLSACETAVGDERAALGLAGVAIKSGARSALASLWLVDDLATATLSSTFYQQLKQQPTKALALQQAQITLLKQPQFRHPAYWSAFILIGNWL